MLDLGIIEGFYGRPWSWEDRRAIVSQTARQGYRFFLYAPKGDPFLRKSWRERFPREHETELRWFVEFCETSGVEFGVGLSPYEIYRGFDSECRAALKAKVELFNRWGVHRLSLLFDDMRGDLPGLAQAQIEIAHFVRSVSTARRLVLCPTYYSPDPVLDRVFGPRPEGYLQELGADLDPAIGLYWTGEEICSKHQSVLHLRETASLLGRKPDLWDNYPVNDGQRMCKFLHLRPFEGRDPALADELASHGVNPMNQAHLSLIPALSLSRTYRGLTSDFAGLSREACSPPVAELLGRDLEDFQDRGLDGLSVERKAGLIADYERFDEPVAREVSDWLRGNTVVTRELVLTQ